MNGIARLSPLEAKQWVLEHDVDNLTVSGIYNAEPEQLDECASFAGGLENVYRSIRNSKIFCLIDEKPVFEINRMLHQVADTHPQLSDTLKRIDAIRDAIARTFEIMIASHQWDHEITAIKERRHMNDAGMRLAQYRVMRDIGHSILGIFANTETALYSLFISGMPEDEGNDIFRFDSINEVVGVIELEQALICEWVESTLLSDKTH